MLVTVLHRLAGTPAVSGTHGFQDTKQEGWYADAVTWATKNGIVDGLGNGNFAPDAAITREQLVSILYRYAKSCGYNVSASADLTTYQDNADVSAWARDAMRWAVGCGLISGRSATKLAPRESATRAEVAVMLMNFMKLIAK